MLYILWRNRPMRGLLKSRNLKERDCATVAERYRILPPLSSPRFALPSVARLRGNTGWRNSKDHVTSVTSRATAHGAAFSTCWMPGFMGETEGSAAPVKYKQF
jgi:hypothetical protein